MRVFLKGLGYPIPDEAMPGPGASELPPITLNLPTGTFEKAPYLEMGYTNYEVWCIGGAGGMGGMPSGVWFESDFEYQLYPQEAIDEMTDIFVSYFGTLENVPTPWQWMVDFIQSYEEGVTTSKVQVFRDPYLTGSSSYGGAGGGGGLHYTQGELESLPDSVTVVVGQAGADAGPGQIEVLDGPYTPIPIQIHHYDPEDPHFTYEDAILNVLNPISYQYPEPHPSFDPIIDGVDGGASSFNDTTCRASGGKGGAHCPLGLTGTNRVGGNGGDGGIGGATLAGNGAEGSTSDANGRDGIWDGEIGEGGGGGRGGVYIPGSGGPGRPVLMYVNTASNGGVGSFSYGDTSYYGTKGQRLNDQSNWPIIPGAGGGAKIGLLKYGAKVPEYSPQGAVIIRLTKVG